ncbi:MAG: restriction endonuclease subunit S [Planctomycetales bacterium]|nr:restriction endonuclease subunit S [Planctomycetales bacterium]
MVDEWKKGRLRDLATIAMGNSPPSSTYNMVGDGVPLVNGPTEFTDTSPIAKQWTTAPQRFCEKGDILLCVRGSSTGRINVADQQYCIGRGVAAIRSSEGTEGNAYLKQLLLELVTQILTTSVGSTFPSVDKGSLQELEVNIPPADERKRIAALLSCWDKNIEVVNKLIALKKTKLRAIAQQLMQSRRSPYQALSSVLTKVNLPIVPNETELYREIGIRSHGRGIFHKEPTSGLSLGTKRVYRVKPDCFVFNVVFAWEQAVARTTERENDMIASHRFPMYEPIGESVDVDYLLYFFKTPRGKHLLGLASPGGAGRNRTLSQEAFMKLKIPLPDIDRQRLIAKALAALDREIEILERLQDGYAKQKRGLMQQLLTGKVRVSEGVA